MIDRNKLIGQIQSLDRQRQVVLHNLAEIEGAKKQCTHFLGEIEKAEREASKKADTEAASVNVGVDSETDTEIEPRES